MSKYEVRKAANGDTCIMAKDFNARIATFVKGTAVDAKVIGDILAEHKEGEPWTEAGFKFLLHLVDVVWNSATDSEQVPSTKLAESLIKKAEETFTVE